MSDVQGIFTLAGSAGGAGRTTLTLTIGALLAQRGQKVLLVDLDPRGSLTFLAGLEEADRREGILSALGTGRNPAECVRETAWANLSILGSDLRTVAEHLQIEVAVADWRSLPRVLKPLRETWSTILIDTPAGIGRLTRAAIHASDEVLIPLVADPLAIRTLPGLLQVVIEARQVSIHGPQLAGVFLNRVDPSAPLFRQMVRDLSTLFQPLLLDTAIPYDPWFIEAAARAMPLPFLLPEARGVAATGRLLEELGDRLGTSQAAGMSAQL